MPVVLFVCTANICRSPIASGLFSKKLQEKGLAPEWKVASAGTWGESGLPAPDISQKLMRKLDVDLSRHRSRIVTADILKAADLILTMEGGHKEALQVEFPDAANRTHMLSEMVGRKVDVDDPYGRSTLDYQDTIREIKGILDKGFDQILRLADRQKKS